MKYFLLISSLLLIAFTSEAQTKGSSIGNAKSYTPVLGGFKVDSAFYMPKKFPKTYTALDSAGLWWYDVNKRTPYYHDGISRKQVVGKAYVDSAVAAGGGGGSLAIGSKVRGGAIPERILILKSDTTLYQSQTVSITNLGGSDVMTFILPGHAGATQLSAGALTMYSDGGAYGIELDGPPGDSSVYGLRWVFPAGTLALRAPIATGDKVQNLQNDTGYVALIHNVPAVQTFTTSALTGFSHTYTFAVTSSYTAAIAMPQNDQTKVDYCFVSSGVLSVHTTTSVTGTNNILITALLK